MPNEFDARRLRQKAGKRIDRKHMRTGVHPGGRYRYKQAAAAQLDSSAKNRP